jgi:glycosyltransferase involved in cell wall biosynthesis
MIEESISLVMPVNDEQDNIEFVVNSALEILPKITDRFEIILVDDGSTDNTPKIINRLAVINKDVIRVIHHDRKEGYGSALSSGIKIANFDLIFIMDADGQYDINDMGRLLCHIEDNDAVIGYRIFRSDPLHRILLGRAYNFIVNFVLGIKTKDINCGLKLFRKSVLDEMDIKSKGALIYAEILSKSKGKRIKQVGVHHFSRKSGSQKAAKPMAIFVAVFELFNVWRRMRRS